MDKSGVLASFERRARNGGCRAMVRSGLANDLQQECGRRPCLYMWNGRGFCGKHREEAREFVRKCPRQVAANIPLSA